MENPYGGTAWHFYSLGAPRPVALDSVAAAYSGMRIAVPNELYKRAGEEYVRALFVHNDDFEHISQRRNLGRALENGPLTHDLTVTDRRTGERFGVSVKNQNEFIFPGHRAIRDVARRAQEAQILPWLVVPFATEEAAARCERDGIRLTILGRQILPTESEGHQLMRNVIRRFQQHILGEQPFDFIYRRFSKTLRQSLAVERDLQQLSVFQYDHAA
jgi:hypothetical protein